MARKMQVLVSFCLLSAVKVLSRLLFRWEISTVCEQPSPRFKDIRVAILLNHTSLFDVIFLATVPFSCLWEVAKRGLIPGADSTLARPVLGRFMRALVPQMVPVTRVRDGSWRDFVSRVDPKSLVVMAPEGRMKRANGLDKYGRPMTLRGGIVDVFHRIQEGDFFIIYSAGLHHIQTPGERWPRLFRMVRVRLEEIPIQRYLREVVRSPESFREDILADLERRRDRYCQ